MPDKPHRFGSKIFMLCDSRTTYCHSNENGANNPIDNMSGTAAVVRNLKIIFGAAERPRWPMVGIDCFYSYILLATELFRMNVYVVVTIMVDRLGDDQNVNEKRQTRPTCIPRGTSHRKKVHYLCTSAVMPLSTIGRELQQVGAIRVPCLSAVNDNKRWMGGVDVHDQLCLHTYSLQTYTRFKNTTKSLFLGFMDRVLVNAYISHRETAKMERQTAMKRGE
ncbi:hypothetical protein PHMEG_00017120 [Phytophthora megakarya]|uniref:PiggyBac transposable element-derived protein domain-containing protein n=1 Tax=Phytophthora megakarya TaxID=4795 RepID=A0A225VY66_9STRA|nr:hypothetical protein PHMEG_00017120 [Phytophthora megakarya]